MRTIMRMTIPVEAGNDSVADGSMQKTLESLLSDLKPEAAYFFAQNGERGGFIVFDLKDTSQIPSIAEPLFSAFKAKLEFHPAMNVEDVRKALSELGKKSSKAA
jgi:hypothetical protein